MDFVRPATTGSRRLPTIDFRDSGVRPFKPASAKSLGDVLADRSDGLAQLASRARALEQVAKALEELLHGALANQVHVGNVRDGQLTVIVPSPSIASRIRLEAPRIARELAAKGIPVEGIAVKVRPGHQPPQAPKAGKPQQLPDAARRALLDLASLCDDDPDLKASISGLAEVGRASKD